MHFEILKYTKYSGDFKASSAEKSPAVPMKTDHSSLRIALNQGAAASEAALLVFPIRSIKGGIGMNQVNDRSRDIGEFIPGADDDMLICGTHHR